MPNSITKISSSIAGKTVVIMAGVHGNEKVGIQAFDILEKELKISSGTVYLIHANTIALEKGVRFVESNMNRCFSSENKGVTEEEKRAKEIMAILDTADVLLDIHAFNDVEGEAFVITNDRSLAMARILNVPIVSTGWDSIHAGSSDGYMNIKGKIGICIECGPIAKADMFVPLALDSVYRILAECGLISYIYEKPRQQKHVVVSHSIRKMTDTFSFTRQFKNFEKIPTGFVFAKDGEYTYTAENDECIIFLRPHAVIGGDAAIIGKFI
jgi:succinylglutamate desuccinylase